MEDLKKSFLIKGDNIIGALGDKNFSTAPLGTVLSFAGQTAPHGYLLCDGASYKVADYPDLYAVIGNIYGGDSTNFNVPNLVDKFVQGSTASGTEKEAGLPNITGYIDMDVGGAQNTEGAFYKGTSFNGLYGGNVTTISDVVFDASRSNAIYGNSDTVQPPALTMVYIIKAFHTNEGVDSGVSDDVVEYVDNKINDSTTNTTSTWSSSKIAQQINNATAIKYDNVINANTTRETGWNLAQGESHFYGRLLQLDGHLGSKSSTFSFLLFVKANYDNPTTVYVTQLAGMDDDRSNISHTTYFELGVSSSGNLTIKNKSAVVASYRFI